MWRRLYKPISTKFGVFVDLTNVITYAKNGFQIFSCFSRATGGKTHVSLLKANGLYNIAMRYRAGLWLCGARVSTLEANLTAPPSSSLVGTPLANFEWSLRWYRFDRCIWFFVGNIGWKVATSVYLVSIKRYSDPLYTERCRLQAKTCMLSA